MFHFGNSWDTLLADEYNKEYYQNLRKFLINEYKTQTIYPTMDNIFNALKNCDYNDVNAVILGQDPYHEPNQAHGMCFSVQRGVENPPSLKNIFKELYDETGIVAPHGCLESWAKSGVLLLNTVLTVRRGQANSHKGKGWEIFTDKIISLLNERQEPIVFLLWGTPARNKKSLITNKNHLILESVHPSPLSAYNGFFGCNHFIKANEFLAKYNRKIDWEIK